MPIWSGTSVTVSRALKFLLDSPPERVSSVDELADRVGVGSRHLRRLFLRHLGASPLSIVQARRLHFARRLLDETSLPVAEIAFCAGFSSIRRFNDAFRKSFRLTPSELRRQSGPSDPGSAAAGLELRLPFRPPLDWPLLARFLGRRALPGVESVTPDAYRRTVRVGDGCGWIVVQRVPDEACLLLRVHGAAPRDLLPIAERARRLFDLGADPMQVGAVLREDALLQPVIDAVPGLRVPGAWDPFEQAVRAILGQQVSVRGAATLAGRLVAACGERVEGPAPDGLTHVFPSPERVAEADLSGIGMPRARVAAIRELAAQVAAGRLVLASSATLEQTVQGLMQLPGIGRWTAEYIAMRALGEPDAFPAADLGLRKALSSGSGLADAAEVERRAEAWRPWRAYAVVALWLRLELYASPAS
jgi:AraC family transcriptional regulator of adaptative response / DNA-3-methyladenine glycosylase II